jgi:glycosyltransferase involved in cell wall biosynthesis
MNLLENRTRNYRFTVIIPVYNEEDNISALEKKLQLFLPQSLYPACVVFVNDGSSDDSLNRIKEICARNNDFFYLSLQKRGGLSGALKAGIDYTFSDYLGYMDADLQTDPDDFNLLLPHLESYEMVIGIRANRKDSFFKNLQSKIANGFRRMMTHDGVSDTGCPLKVMYTDAAKKMPLFNGMHRFLPALILLQNGKVKQIPVRHYPRVAGKSKYNLWNRLTGPFIDCFAYRWMKKRYINYQVSDSNLN